MHLIVSHRESVLYVVLNRGAINLIFNQQSHNARGIGNGGTSLSTTASPDYEIQLASWLINE